MKKLILAFLTVLMACVSDNPKVTISNNTKTNYDSIRVFSTPNAPTIFKNIGANQVLNGRILFDQNNTSDGAYTIQIYMNGKIARQKCFGYYTNGKSLNRFINVVIEADTLKTTLK